MKRDLKFVGDFDLRLKRGRALDQMFADFENDRPMSLNAIEELWESLTPEERAASFDTVAANRLRAYIAEGKPVQAYGAMMAGLRVQPTSLRLQSERGSCLAACFEQLDRLLTVDSQNPMIGIIYDILLKEAYVSPIIQGRYLEHLVRQGKFLEASELALPLIALFPAMFGLRETVEDIAIHIPNERLKEFVVAETATLRRPVTRSVLMPHVAGGLRRKLAMLNDLVQGGATDPKIDEILTEVLGDFSDLSHIDLTLKDFYYFKAIADGERGKSWEAIMLLQTMVEIDPCNMHYRRSLNIEVSRFSSMVIAKAEKNELKIDFARAYTALREIVVVPYTFLKITCLAEVTAGQLSSAKAKMQQLCALNPHDGDYLLAALDVAIEAKDHEWMEQLLVDLVRQRTERPWDLTVAAFETAV